MSKPDRTEIPGPVVEVGFHIRDTGYPFVGISERADCTFELATMIARSEGRYAEFFNVIECDPDEVESLAADYGEFRVSRLTEYERGALFEFVVSEGCPAYELAELGALPRTVEGIEGTGRIAAEIPPQYDPPAVIAAFLDAHPTAELATKREKESISPVFTRSALQQLLDRHLTDRQREVVRAAFEAGYYEWPREATGAEVAAELGISSATFSEHIHAAERKLLSVLFDAGRPDRPGVV